MVNGLISSAEKRLLAPVTYIQANSKNSFENEIMDEKECKSVTSTPKQGSNR
jgi:hypothetical protein